MDSKRVKESFTMIGNKQLLLNIVKQRQVAYLGHIIPKDGRQRLLVEGKLNGKRKEGEEDLEPCGWIISKNGQS